MFMFLVMLYENHIGMQETDEMRIFLYENEAQEYCAMLNAKPEELDEYQVLRVPYVS